MQADMSLKEFKRDFLHKISRKNIIITYHGLLRLRQYFTDEELKDILIDRFPVDVKKNTSGKFELKYNHPNKKIKEAVVIIVVPHESLEKSIRIITTYIK